MSPDPEWDFDQVAGPDQDLDPAALRRLYRPTCPECGGPIRWLTAAEARTQVPYRAEMLAQFGIVTAWDLQQVEFFHCLTPECDRDGLCGPVRQPPLTRPDLGSRPGPGRRSARGRSRRARRG